MYFWAETLLLEDRQHAAMLFPHQCLSQALDTCPVRHRGRVSRPPTYALWLTALPVLVAVKGGLQEQVEGGKDLHDGQHLAACACVCDTVL